MSRLIDADALKEYFFRPYSNEESYSNIELEKIIDAQPTIEERKTGKSIVKSTGYRSYWACDQCGTVIKYTDNFCRHCGADLRGEQE